MNPLPMSITNWETVAPTRHPGESGFALWRTREFGDIRVRMVEYSPGYMADHWCAKGHVILCLDGFLDLSWRTAPVTRYGLVTATTWATASRPIEAGHWKAHGCSSWTRLPWLGAYEKELRGQHMVRGQRGPIVLAQSAPHSCRGACFALTG